MYALHHLCASGSGIPLLLETAGGSHPPLERTEKMKQDP